MSYAEWMENQKKTKTPSSSNSQPENNKKPSYAEWMENQSSQTSVQKWLQNSESLVKEVRDRFRGYDSASMTDKESLTNRTINLISVAEEWKKRYSADSNAVKTIDSMVSMLKNTQKGISDLSDFYSQFKTEEDYNAYNDAVKQQNKIQNLNIDKEELEIRSLEQQLKDASDRNTRAVENGTMSIDDASKNLKGLEDALNEKKRDLTLAKRYNRSQELSSVTSASDFEVYAAKGAAIENPTYEEAHGGFSLGTWRPYGQEVKNKVTFTQENIDKLDKDQFAASIGGAGGESLEDVYQVKRAYTYMTDEEVNIYNYYLGKGDKSKADEYLDSLTDTLNSRAATADYEKLYKDNTAIEFLFSMAAGTDQFISGMKAVFSDADYIPQSKTQYTSGMIREDLADVGGQLPKAMGGGSVGQMFYDIGTTTTNMLPSILVSMLPGGQIAGTALLGTSAAGNAYSEMLNLGYDKDQSRLYAGMVGASEAGLQYVMGGISKLGGKVSGNIINKLVNKVDNALARTAIKLGGSIGSEFSEEYLQEVLTPVYRNIAFNEDNEVDFFSEEALYAGFLGALTAGFLEGGGTISGEVNNYTTGKNLISSGVTSKDLARLGNTFSADSIAYQLAGRVDENTGAYTLGRMFNEMGATLTEQNIADIKENLKSQGVDTKSAETLANALSYVVNGNMSLTEAQAAALEANDTLSRAVVESIINPNSTEYQRTSNYYDMLESLAKEMTAEPSVESVNDKTAEQTEKAATEANVPSEEVDISEALVSETIASMGVNPSAANILMENFKSPANKLSAEVYSKGIEEAYRYGSLSIPISDMIRNGAFSKDLSRHQRTQAYNLGEQAAKAKVEKQQAKIDSIVAKKDGKNAKNINSKVHFDRANRKFNAQQESALAVMDVISAATGTDIYVFESYVQNGKRVYKDNKGNVVPAPNGFYDPKDGSIHLDLNAGASGRGTMLFTATHEFTHKIKDSSPAKYKLLADTLMKAYASRGVSVDSLVQRQIDKAKAAKRELTYEEAYDEVIADSMESILQSGNVLETLAEIKQQDKSLWQTIVNFFKEFAAKIRQAVAAYKGITPDSIEGRMIAEMKDFASELEQIYADALADVGNVESGSVAPALSARIDTDQDSEGNTLSEQQQEFFKDSKVRDEKGRLLVMYHGTPNAGFTKFKSGSYFTQNKKWADVYQSPTASSISYGKSLTNPDTYAVYLNIKKPFDTRNKKERDIFYNEYYRQWGTGTDLAESGLPDWLDGMDLQEFLEENEYDYDGLILDEGGVGGYGEEVVSRGLSYVTFDAAQIKNINNTSPTSDPDIRYQEREIRSDDARLNNKYSYENLVAKPDMAITELGTVRSNNRSDIVQEAKQKAAKVGKFDAKTGGVSVYVADINTDVVLSAKGLRHGLRRSKNLQDDINAVVTVHAGEILRNAIRINQLTPTDANADGSYVLIGTAKDDGNTYIVRFVVNHFDNAVVSLDVLYAIKAKKELAALNAPRLTASPLSVTSSTISISDLLDYVNEHYPDILSESVLRHFGHNERPSGDLGASALYQLRNEDAVSNRSLLANAFEGIAQNEIEKKKIAEYKSQVERLDAESQRLNDINAEIKELSFAKGARDTAKLKELRDEATKTVNRINTLDKKLLGLEASKPLQAVLQREKQKAYKRAEAKGKQALKDFRQQANERIQKAKKAIMEKNAASRQNAIERRSRKETRRKIQKVVRDLNQFLLRPDKKKHVPVNMQKAVAEALDIVNMDTVSADERVAKYDVLIANATNPEIKASLEETRNRIAYQGSRMAEKLDKLHSAYEEFIESDDPDIANAYDEVISNLISSTAKEIGETPLRDMSLEQLESVYDMYKAVLTRVRDANKTFAENLKVRINDIVGNVFGELSRLKDKKRQTTKIKKDFDKFSWNNTKPVYAFERIGSRTLTQMYENIRKGEDTWGVDIEEAKAFSNSMKEKYGYKKWNKDKEYEFESATGKKFTLNLEEMMSIYAEAKREADIGTQHLRKGGFIYDDNAKSRTKKVFGLKMKVIPEDATFHKLNDQLIQDIISTMNTVPGVRGFVDEMQGYLSRDMGSKGNEVSMALYGIKLYKEKNYFPLHVSSDYNARIESKQKGEVKIKNAGFTKEINTKASAPVVLTPFMDVWAEHVNDMAMYHSFVLPLEDFYRVYNSNSGTSEYLEAESIKQQIKAKHGVAATGYIEQLLKDINGDVRSDPRESFFKSLISGFKKAAVMASLSVVIQQPSSFARALSMIDARDFMYKPSKLSPNKLWAEVKKYAPIAIIKEMGKFDTDVGQSTVDYIKDERNASSVIDKILGTAPAKADQITWNHIWMAVKHEIARKNKDLTVGSEEFFKKAGERFTEVITKTQVYDSVFSRSANMRSKNAAMQMVTAFLAEPTTTLNMYQNVIWQSKMGYKKAAGRTIAFIYTSIALNAALSSVVYAMRDDDDDETLLEKYLQSFTRELIDGVNPISYAPFIKDVWSIAQGFTVERADMSMVQDLWTSIETFQGEAIKDTSEMDEDQLKEHDEAMITAAHDLASAMSAMFGLPIGNIIRDVKGGINLFNTATNGLNLDEDLLWDKVLESLKSSVPIWGKEKTDKKDKLYETIIRGDKAYIDRLKATYEDEDKYNNALKEALQKNDTRIKDAAQARYNGDIALYAQLFKEIQGEENFEFDTIRKAINSEFNKLKPDAEPSSKEYSMFNVDDAVQAAINGDTALAREAKADIIKVAMENGKTKDQATTSFNNSFSTKVKEKTDEGIISSSQAQRLLEAVGDKTAEEALDKVRYWEVTKRYPDADISDDAVKNYRKPIEDLGYSIEDAGISMATYVDYDTKKKKCKGVDEDGDGKTDTGSKKAEILLVIDSLDLTPDQKDALYFDNGWAASKLHEAPWR